MDKENYGQVLHEGTYSRFLDILRKKMPLRNYFHLTKEEEDSLPSIDLIKQVKIDGKYPVDAIERKLEQLREQKGIKKISQALCSEENLSRDPSLRLFSYLIDWLCIQPIEQTTDTLLATLVKERIETGQIKPHEFLENLEAKSNPEEVMAYLLGKQYPLQKENISVLRSIQSRISAS